MKRFLTIVLIGCWVMMHPSFAWANPEKITQLSSSDTIILQINKRGQKLFEHYLKKGETLYSVSQFYGMTVPVLLDYNPQLTTKSILSIGTHITIPLPNRAILRKLKSTSDPKKYVPIIYIVKKGDTMYGVAKRAFRSPVKDLMKKNNLKNHTLEVGQQLLVGWIRITPFKREWQIATYKHGVSFEKLKNKNHFTRKSFKRKTYTHKGKAQWDNSNQMGLSGLFCLHRSAKKGSIVRITNPISKRVAYAKVLGKVPLNFEPKVIIVVSKDVAKALKEKESTFFVEVEYLK